MRAQLEEPRSQPSAPLSCSAELELLLRSGWRVVVLETFEEDRALRVLEQVARTQERALVPWSSAAGTFPS